MYSEEDLDEAVASGAISADAVEALREHVARRRALPMVDEEPIRLITGFNDIFVVIAGTLLLLAIAWLGSLVAGWLGMLLLAVSAWGLAEFFTRKQHMALPSILLLLAFVHGCAWAVMLAPWPDAEEWQLWGKIGLSGAVGAVAGWLHWRRFRVPIAIAAGSAALAVVVLALLLFLVPAAKEWLLQLIFLCGCAIFALALYWDASDPERRTRRSDVAFWLHLISSPLLVHPVFSEFSKLDNTAVIGLYLVVIAVSVAIDRRALMVTALGYVLYAFASLLSARVATSLNFVLTALLMGGSLLLLSAFWQPCRRWVLRWLPASIRRHLAPLRADPVAERKRV